MQTPEETLDLRSGSCRDTGWLLVQMLRHLGLAARFVSGYLIQLDAGRQVARRPVGPDRRLHRPPRLGRGLPARRGLDRPRSDLRPARRRRPHPARLRRRSPRAPRRSPAPSTSARSTSRTTMAVRRIYESPRVTKPYTEEQWRAIDALGHARRRGARQRRRAADDGRRADVRLDRRHGRRRVEHRGARPAQARARRHAAPPAARSSFAPGGLLHFGQGKWYPGESLPRWALGCCWRRDGVPIWNDDRSSPTRRRDLRPRRRRRAQRFVDGAGRAARRRAAHARSPPTRTSGTTCGRSGGCRSTSTRCSRELKDAEERARLARIFEQGLGSRRRLRPAAAAPATPTGAALGERPLVLPLRAPVPDSRRLADGLSPAARLACRGCRPRRSRVGRRPRSVRRAAAAAACPAHRPARHAAQAAGRRGRRSTSDGLQRQTLGPRNGERGAASAASANRRPASCARRSASSRATAASTCSCRRCGSAEDYLDLVAAIEATAAAARDAGDHRRRRRRPTIRGSAHFKVTPDPGVIEVNLHPAAQLGRARRPHDHALRGGAADAARHREVHARRPPHRHRRRQPHRPRRRDAGRQPVPAAAGSAAQPGRLLAQPPVAVVPVLGPVHRPDQPASARRRGAQRLAARARDRVRADRRTRRRRRVRRGWSIACSATC